MPKLSTFAANEPADSRYAEVQLGPRKHPDTGEDVFFKFKIQRIETGAALMQSVPALVTALPSLGDEGEGSGKGSRPARPLNARQAQQLTHHFHGIICASVIQEYDDDTDTWDKITLDPVRHDPANGIIALNWFMPHELMQLVDAIIKLQTGKEVGAMLATLFQGAQTVFKTVLDGAVLSLRSLHNPDDVDTGTDGGERGGIEGRDGGDSQEPSE